MGDIMSTKITLDGQALERLLGGDTEVEAELRNCVVQEFAKKHLKAIANSEVFQGFVKKEIDKMRLAAELAVNEAIFDTKKDSWNRVVTNGFKEGLKKQIAKDVSFAFEQELGRQLNKMIDERLNGLTETVEGYIDSKVKNYGKYTIDKMVEEKFKAAMKNIS